MATGSGLYFISAHTFINYYTRDSAVLLVLYSQRIKERNIKNYIEEKIFFPIFCVPIIIVQLHNCFLETSFPSPSIIQLYILVSLIFIIGNQTGREMFKF